MGYKLNPFIISVLGFNSLIIIRMKPPKKQRKGHENVNNLAFWWCIIHIKKYRSYQPCIYLYRIHKTSFRIAQHYRKLFSRVVLNICNYRNSWSISSIKRSPMIPESSNSALFINICIITVIPGTLLQQPREGKGWENSEWAWWNNVITRLASFYHVCLFCSFMCYLPRFGWCSASSYHNVPNITKKAELLLSRTAGIFHLPQWFKTQVRLKTLGPV